MLQILTCGRRIPMFIHTYIQLVIHDYNLLLHVHEQIHAMNANYIYTGNFTVCRCVRAPDLQHKKWLSECKMMGLS